MILAHNTVYAHLTVTHLTIPQQSETANRITPLKYQQSMKSDNAPPANTCTSQLPPCRQQRRPIMGLPLIAHHSSDNSSFTPSFANIMPTEA
ncbi:hypothetical protein NPIL_562681 [Nephila pilipes]|uniref:Uncharacterized protein n=1 Tax=Nephila pilipes TaxID=299642 RepID=A0A8X6NTG8_NEPPI|nr:hypothetical protein NPIL_562681 [Nephila pilipes]